MTYRRRENWKRFPELKRLKDLSTPPKEIYYTGNWNPEIFKKCVAVVGSRRMSEYGRRVIEKIIPQLVLQKKTIISGFMYGIDQYTHQICVESGGKTIAVLGWGINVKLDGYDKKLANKIVESGGLIISEWEEQQAAHWTFPARNRIVAALSSEIIIVEAAMKSGSLITARIGNRLKRKIWAVPGPITSRTSAGTNLLIAQNKAQMWIDSFLTSEKITTGDPLLDLLSNEALTTNEIARKINIPVSEIGAQLSLLTISGQLTEREGKYYLNNAG
ncbi:DNA-protecting protein DprA [Candidatus Gottesmanbacteria bacterium]|nr:DNA-protecting protein DprA [Candidatus Gottesmanbacteria bacterium]